MSLTPQQDRNKRLVLVYVEEAQFLWDALQSIVDPNGERLDDDPIGQAMSEYYRRIQAAEREKLYDWKAAISELRKVMNIMRRQIVRQDFA